MGRKGKHKGRKKERREAALAEAAGAEAVRERGARARLEPELWIDPGQVVADERTTEPAAAARPVRARPRLAALDKRGDALDPAELAARLASLGTLLQRLQGHGDAEAEGLTRARLSALSVLVLGGARRLGDLAAAERVRPPTMSRLVDAMEADGWVVREPDPADGRSVIVRATPAGEVHLVTARSRQLAPLAGALADLDGAERRTLEAGTDVLERLLRTSTRQDEPLAE
jgi:DNA-binding MarR family transcriptional regulator